MSTTWQGIKKVFELARTVLVVHRLSIEMWIHGREGSSRSRVSVFRRARGHLPVLCMYKYVGVAVVVEEIQVNVVRRISPTTTL